MYSSKKDNQNPSNYSAETIRQSSKNTKKTQKPYHKTQHPSKTHKKPQITINTKN